MAISPSGRSDVYWVNGKLQIGDDSPCCEKSVVTRTSTRVSHSWELNSTENSCKIAVTSQGEKKLIDIRRYSRDKWGSLGPSKNGVCLNMDEYKRIKSLLTQIDKELAMISSSDGSNDEITGWHPLSVEHVLRVGLFASEGMKELGVDFREQRNSDTGELKPTGKGLTLSPSEWCSFKGVLSEMEEKELYALQQDF